MDVSPETKCLNDKALIAWAEKYEKDLTRLADDLELIIDKKFEISIAMDFFDIYMYLFPLTSSSRANNTREDIKKTVARDAIFTSLGSIYTYPIIILPPYQSETKYHFDKAELGLFKLFDESYKDIVTDKLDKFLHLIKEQIENNKPVSFDLLGNEIFELTLFYSKYFMDGLKGFSKMREDKIIGRTPSTKRNFVNLLNDIKEMDNMKYYKQFRALRPSKGIENISDSKAIQYVKEINDRIEGKFLLSLVTSSPLFIIFNMFIKTDKYIGEKAFPCIRNTEDFYMALIKLLHFSLVSSDPNINRKLDENELKHLFKFIKDELLLLKSFKHISHSTSKEIIDGIESGAISGKRFFPLAEIPDQLLSLKNFTDKIEKDLLLTRIQRDDTDLASLYKETDKKLVGLLTEFRDNLVSERFYDTLVSRLTELEEEYKKYEFWIINTLGILSPTPDGPLLCKIIPWSIADSDGGCIEHIKRRDFKFLADILINKDLKFIDNPDFIELSKSKYLIYDRIIENELIYIVEVNDRCKCTILRIDINYIYLLLIRIYKKALDKEYESNWIRNCELMKLLDEILPHQQIIKLHKYDIINEFYINLRIKLLYDTASELPRSCCGASKALPHID